VDNVILPAMELEIALHGHSPPTLAVLSTSKIKNSTELPQQQSPIISPQSPILLQASITNDVDLRSDTQHTYNV